MTTQDKVKIAERWADGEGGSAMTTSRQYSESEGEFSHTEQSARPCRQCGSRQVKCQTWESNDGAYEDYRYTCQDWVISGGLTGSTHNREEKADEG